eukprot:TRINITY_DN9661_c0_g1_i2.p1 TRINITY_DN9661_c0_g1~~TRINITY_DN9661_c0_g1_i2.p1  ORF type:complete len:435 (+),score=52.11 TRINITY_DN9661_c0_g1_i2:352-1656(+)
MIKGSANALFMGLLWFCYQSIVNVGQTWYSFGWESQLLETGFLAIFLCPLFSLQPVSTGSPPPLVVILGYRWLLFRIMLGAGLIKLRGDQCWRDLTCMEYHYQTQPVPNPLSPLFHYSARWFHMVETIVNHFVEVPAPFFLFLPRDARVIGGIIQAAFQAVLISSGNLSFLNWLTMLPAFACFDDKFLGILFSAKRKAEVIAAEEHYSRQGFIAKYFAPRRWIQVVLLGIVSYLSVPVVQNLLSPHQAMNTNFDFLRIVNTYGAFGSITKTRHEVVLQGTHSHTIDKNTVWKDYEFKCKPGNVTRRPCFISPYHYRLDWLMWFAAFQTYQQNPWLVHLTAKLLINDAVATSLLAAGGNPFENDVPPSFIRAELYRYEYAPLSRLHWWATSSNTTALWWRRKRVKSYFPVVDLRALEPVLRQQGWPVPQPASWQF